MIYNPKLIVKGNKWKHENYVNRPRVLIVGPASPSTGGISSYVDALLSFQLEEHFHLRSFNPLIVKNRSEKQESHLDFKEMVAGIKVLKSFIEYMKRFNPTIVHIHTSSH